MSMDDEIGTRALDTITVEMSREDAVVVRNMLYAGVDALPHTKHRVMVLGLCEEILKRLRASGGQET